MINANELRIGNWVNDVNGGGYNNPGFQKVTSIGYDGINSWQDMSASGNAKFEDIDPILLTPEILEKAKVMYKHFADEFYIRITSAGVCIGQRTKGLKYLNHIKFFHQLQNLYFALTGEDLNITLD